MKGIVKVGTVASWVLFFGSGLLPSEIQAAAAGEHVAGQDEQAIGGIPLSRFYDRIEWAGINVVPARNDEGRLEQDLAAEIAWSTRQISKSLESDLERKLTAAEAKQVLDYVKLYSHKR